MVTLSALHGAGEKKRKKRKTKRKGDGEIWVDGGEGRADRTGSRE